MISPELNMRLAGEDDVPAVAHILNVVSEGVIEHLLTGVVPGMGPEKLLQMVLMRGQGAYDLKTSCSSKFAGRWRGFFSPTTRRFRKCPP